ncbi:hypothetical protein [Mycoplasmopsis primatum]|uniref:hypothetical protein n=1 Tax=Mycoplasmopsis primatum TaxID=55604 RepID=UPI0004974534|nr:hypothetical protein [Mycoplasmopsis primatum]
MKETNNINIDDIELALGNIRFSEINKIKFDFIKHFNSFNRDYNKDKENLEIWKLIIDDFDSFLDLINSMANFGYKPAGEKIILIRKENDDAKYIVVEGNRRISCIKILNNIKQFLDYLEDYKIIFDSDQQQLANKLRKRLIAINSNRFNSLNTFLKKDEYDILDDNSNISSIIFNKHINSSTTGLSHWKKGKYYLDLLKIFREENIDSKNKLLEFKNDVEIRFNKKIDKVWAD